MDGFEKTRITPDTAPRTPKLLSVVAPVYNEQELVEEFIRRTCAAAADYTFELVIVNDGSSDGTPQLLDRIAAADPRVRVIHLSRNFGHQAALTAGLEHAAGDVVAMLDADLQDPPELIGEMIAQWSQGSDVVYAVREQREGETAFKLATASWFYKLFDKLAQVDLEPNSGDFRLLDRRVADVMVRLPERTRFMKGLFAWVGFKQTAIYYDREERQAGGTKWNYWRLWNFAMDGITSFSSFPLKVWAYFGFVISAFAFLYAVVLAIRKLLNDVDVPGYTSLMVVVLFLGGIQLITLGILGEYMGRVYNEVKGRPLYVVRDRYGFDED